MRVLSLGKIRRISQVMRSSEVCWGGAGKEKAF